MATAISLLHASRTRRFIENSRQEIFPTVEINIAFSAEVRTLRRTVIQSRQKRTSMPRRVILFRERFYPPLTLLMTNLMRRAIESCALHLRIGPSTRGGRIEMTRIGFATHEIRRMKRTSDGEPQFKLSPGFSTNDRRFCSRGGGGVKASPDHRRQHRRSELLEDERCSLIRWANNKNT